MARERSRALTPAQQRCWEAITRAYGPGDVFQARDLFPGRTAEASAGRRTLAGLRRQGVLQDAAGQGEVPGWASGVYLVPSSPPRPSREGH